MTAQRPVNYWDYLGLDRLLTLQNGLESDEADLAPDELHFIVVHQVYELWLKMILRELRMARDELAQDSVDEKTVPVVVHHLGRVEEILRLMTSQWAVMETLAPQDFLAFRDKLSPASGFQSFQMREVELLMGLSSDQRLRYGGVDPVDHILAAAEHSPSGDFVRARVEQVRGEGSLREALEAWLYRTPIQGSKPGSSGDDEAVAGFLESYLAAYEKNQRSMAERLARDGIADPAGLEKRVAGTLSAARAFLTADDIDADDRARCRRVRAALVFIESYRDMPLVAWPRMLIDRIVAVEEYMVLWRTRHARMVERTIGRRIGTGGSSGVDYLDEAAKVRVFTDLWAVRSILLPREELPPLRDPDSYDFAQ